MMTKRFLATCGVLGGLAIVLAIAGYLLGIPIVLWKLGVLGAQEAIITSPSEPAGVAIATALLFAWPPISTLVAVALHRWRRRADASVRVVLAYLAIPVALTAGYIVLRTYQLPDMFGDGVRPAITLRSLGPGTDEARLVVFASICVWLFIGTRKPAKEVAS
jgi:hypothetical protein